MKEIKRVVGLLLCFVMVFGLLPVHALALDFNDDVQAEELIGEFIPGDVHQEILTPDATAIDNEGDGYLPGGTYYELDQDGVDAGAVYLIVSGNSGTAYALRNNSGSAYAQEVEITGGAIATGFSNESASQWTFSQNNNSWNIFNSYNNRYSRYVRLYDAVISSSNRNLTVSHEGSGAYRIGYAYSTRRTYYLTYNGSWLGSETSPSNVYLFKQTTAKGPAVTFAVNPGSCLLTTGQEENLTPTVKVNNQVISAEDYTITWTSSEDAVAKVENGTVTAVAAGEATITATLTTVNGAKPVETIDATIQIVVTNKKINKAELTGNSQIDVTLNKTPNYSNIKYTVTYDDDDTTTETFTVGNGLTVSECDTSTSGRKIVDILFNGAKIGEVIVNVTVDFSKLPVADMDNAPEYPKDGAVRIDKTATHSDNEFHRTGVTRVELDVAGISVIQGVDVILVADISNSMAWEVATKGTSDATKLATGNTPDKWDALQSAAGTFINTLLSENDDGSDTKNTVSFVTFGGYDKDRNKNSSSYSSYADAVQTVFTSYNDAKSAIDIINAIDIYGTATSNGGANYTISGLPSGNGAAQGGTNYDYAFLETAAAINKIKSEYAAANDGANYDNSGREIYIVFMTDGAPDHYNQLYYKTRSTSQFDYYALYRNDNDTAFLKSEYFEVAGHTRPEDYTYTQRQKPNGYYIPSSNMSNNDWTSWIESDSLYVAEQVMEIPRVRSITSIGFDLANGAFGDFSFSLEILEGVLSNLAGKDSCDVFTTDEAGALQNFYESLAHGLKYAGTEAVVKDEVDSHFSVQMYPYVLDGSGNQIELKTAPSITVTSYDLHPRGTMEDGHDVTGMRTGDATPIEEVTFKVVNGTLCAYSDVIGEDTNILTIGADGSMVINAQNFTYTKDANSEEHFTWNIGNITDKEIALAFDVYLEGSMTGKCPEGIYYTNEEATLEYVDINGQYAKKIFPIPGVVWGGASTTIRFYLVNEKGEPVNRAGVVVPWENRIYVGDPVIVPLNLNDDLTIEAQKIEAAAHVPSGFFLYDYNAYYTVQTTSSDEAIKGGIAISEPSEDAKKTTGSGVNSKTQTGAQTTRVISADVPYYSWSYVGFGVRWDLTAEKTKYPLISDKVVIDYGKAIDIDVLANDPVRTNPPAGEAAFNRELVGFVKFDGKADLDYVQTNPGSATYNAEYGKFSVVDGKVQFQPTKIVNNVQSVYYAVRYTQDGNASNSFILWGRLDVIPATIMYYETDFATGVFTTDSTWATENKGADADGPQNDGTIGHNTYGFDSTYDNDAYLSNGSSLFVKGQGYDSSADAEGNTVYTSKTYTTFSFTGTGFDLISRTGTEQGLIKVLVATNSNMTDIVRTVSVLNKSESSLELYQIPVVSINGLDHGTYHVRIEVDAAYANTLLPVLNRGNEFYFDAIRIYDPAKGNTIAEDAYKADGEAKNNLDEVRQMLISKNSFDQLTGNTDGMVFVDNSGEVDNEGNPIAGGVYVADYTTIGPNNEVYLSKGQAVAFKVEASSTPASFDIGAKSITGSTAGLKVTVRNAEGSKSWTVTKEKIESSTVQFIDLLPTGADASLLSNGAYVVITNTGDGVLSITDLKTAFAGNSASTVGMDNIRTAADPFAVSYTVDASTLDVARMVLSGAVEPEIPDEPVVDISDYAILDATLKVIGSKKNQKCTFTVVTKQSVESIEIAQNAEELIPTSITFKDKKNGIRTWTIVLTSGDYDSHSFFVVTGVGEDGVRGQSVSVHNIKSR